MEDFYLIFEELLLIFFKLILNNIKEMRNVGSRFYDVRRIRKLSIDKSFILFLIIGVEIFN